MRACGLSTRDALGVSEGASSAHLLRWAARVWLSKAQTAARNASENLCGDISVPPPIKLFQPLLLPDRETSHGVERYREDGHGCLLGVACWARTVMSRH